jgi:alkyl sulfatase BDS1-like metallo-beta-lactamase superfamily hydrolase
MSNMTLVESDHGVIVIDPLISAEVAAAAIALYRAHRGDRAVGTRPLFSCGFRVWCMALMPECDK